MAAPKNKLGKLVALRLTADEKSAVTALAETASVSESEAIRRLIRAATGLPLPVQDVDREALRRADEQLRMVGNNLNQATRAMNAGRVGYEPTLAEALVKMVGAVAGVRDAIASRTRTRWKARAQ